MLRPLYFKKDIGTVLVKLKESGAIETPDANYKSYSRGEAVLFSKSGGGTYKGEALPIFGTKELIGKEVFFEEFKDTCQVEEDDEKFAFIDLNDIRGCKDE